MTDLKTMDGVAALNWLSDGKYDMEDVMVLVDKGLTDTDDIVRFLPDAWLVDDWEGDVTPETLSSLKAVGIGVLKRDPDNAAEWAALAPLADEVTHHSSHEAFDEFLDAGRGPTYAKQILEAANRHNANPPEYGYGEDITPAVFASLAESGMGNAALESYRAAGLSIADALRVHAEGLSPAAVQWAVTHNIPREDWRESVGGIPSNWFAALYERGSQVSVYSIDDLRYLAAKRWDAGDHASGFTAFTPDTARLLADAGLSWHAVTHTWKEALTVGTGGNKATSALMAGGSAYGARHLLSSEDYAKAALRLHALGVRAGHLSTYRMAGCKSVDDVARLAERGINHEIVTAFRNEFGKGRHSYDKNRYLTGPEQVEALYEKYRSRDAAPAEVPA